MKSLVKFGGLVALMALAVSPAFANRVDGGTSNSGVTSASPNSIDVTLTGTGGTQNVSLDGLDWENTPGLTVYELSGYQNYTSITLSDTAGTFDLSDAFGSFVCEAFDVNGAGNTDDCDGQVSAPTDLIGTQETSSSYTFTLTGADNGNAGTADAANWFFYVCSGSNEATCSTDVEAALVTTTPTPEPESFSLLGLGLAGGGLAMWRRRRGFAQNAV